MSSRVTIVNSTAVYDGRTYLGDIAQLASGQYLAVDPNQNRLGVFDKKVDAERLVLSCREKGGPDG